MPNLTGRALAAKQEQEARSAELRASWLARSRADAVRRWESTLGPTKPEDWRPCAPDNYEHDHLRVTVEGFVFTQEHRYYGGSHHYSLNLRGARGAPVRSEYDLHTAFASMTPWSLLAARVRGRMKPQPVMPAKNEATR